MSEHNNSRRDFLKKTAYIAPVVITLNAAPRLASAGSIKGNNGFGNGCEGTPPGLLGGGADSAHVDQDETCILPPFK